VGIRADKTKPATPLNSTASCRARGAHYPHHRGTDTRGADTPHHRGANTPSRAPTWIPKAARLIKPFFAGGTWMPLPLPGSNLTSFAFAASSSPSSMLPVRPGRATGCTNWGHFIFEKLKSQKNKNVWALPKLGQTLSLLGVARFTFGVAGLGERCRLAGNTRSASTTCLSRTVTRTRASTHECTFEPTLAVRSSLSKTGTFCWCSRSLPADAAAAVRAGRVS
jgi:hypothetical protein